MPGTPTCLTHYLPQSSPEDNKQLCLGAHLPQTYNAFQKPKGKKSVLENVRNPFTSALSFFVPNLQMRPLPP